MPKYLPPHKRAGLTRSSCEETSTLAFSSKKFNWKSDGENNVKFSRSNFSKSKKLGKSFSNLKSLSASYRDIKDAKLYGQCQLQDNGRWKEYAVLYKNRVFIFDGKKGRVFKILPVNISTAAMIGYNDLVIKFIKEGQGPNGDGITRRPLHMAANYGKVSTALILLKANADPNMRSPEGWGTLHTAATSGHYKMVCVLLAGKADPNLEDKGGFLPLVNAINCKKGENPQMIYVLLKAGADPRLPQRDGRNAISAAVLSGHTATLKMFLETGVKPHGPDGFPETLVMAAGMGNAAICILLLQARGDPTALDGGKFLVNLKSHRRFKV